MMTGTKVMLMSALAVSATELPLDAYKQLGVVGLLIVAIVFLVVLP